MCSFLYLFYVLFKHLGLKRCQSSSCVQWLCIFLRWSCEKGCIHGVQAWGIGYKMVQEWNFPNTQGFKLCIKAYFKRKQEDDINTINWDMKIFNFLQPFHCLWVMSTRSALNVTHSTLGILTNNSTCNLSLSKSSLVLFI